MSFMVDTSQFKQMLSFKPFVNEKSEKKKVKYQLLDSIKESIGEKWYRFKEGTRQIFDMVCFLGAELGFFYPSDDYLAERHDISDRTVRNRFKELEELGQVIKLHRRTKKCNGRGKPIYLFVNHPYFKYWVDLLGIKLEDFQTDFQTENDETPLESKDEQAEISPTYSLPKKQEKDINISSYEDFLINLKKTSNSEKMRMILNYKVDDLERKGILVENPSSYLEQIVKSVEKQVYGLERMKYLKEKSEKRKKEKRVQEQNLKPLPFYNWLEQ